MKLLPILTAALAVTLVGCKRDDGSSPLDDVNRGLESGMDQAGKLGTAAGEEISKLHVLEYKVVELERDLPAPEMERELAKLGAERWDCFHVKETTVGAQVFCKRYPKTLLRYIPRIF